MHAIGWTEGDQTASDGDQTASEADQSAADADQSAAESDQVEANSDDRAAKRDQASADRDHASTPDPSSATELAYDTSRRERESSALARFGNMLRRAQTMHDRDGTAGERDRTAGERDRTARSRTVDLPETTSPSSSTEVSLRRQVASLNATIAADRDRAAADRQRAAGDRATAARERIRLESEIRLAHLDELTRAYRREPGIMALSHEIERARRSDGRFVMAFVDVDRLKEVNDTQGHAAGDEVLQAVVQDIRSRLRSFDPIMRYGGDEFVCGLGGLDLKEAKRRFAEIAVAVQASAHVGISVGLVSLRDGDTVPLLTERADAAMLLVKAQHRAAV